MLNEVLIMDNFLARLSQRYFYKILYWINNIEWKQNKVELLLKVETVRT